MCSVYLLFCCLFIWIVVVLYCLHVKNNIVFICVCVCSVVESLLVRGIEGYLHTHTHTSIHSIIISIGRRRRSVVHVCVHVIMFIKALREREEGDTVGDITFFQ